MWIVSIGFRKIKLEVSSRPLGELRWGDQLREAIDCFAAH